MWNKDIPVPVDPSDEEGATVEVPETEESSDGESDDDKFEVENDKVNG